MMSMIKKHASISDEHTEHNVISNLVNYLSVSGMVCPN